MMAMNQIFNLKKNIHLVFREETQKKPINRPVAEAKADGDPYGIRIRIATVKGWRPNR